MKSRPWRRVLSRHKFIGSYLPEDEGGNMFCGDVTSWLSAILMATLSYSRAALAPVIAIVPAYIAWQQWQTNRNKLKLDLYERRFKAFAALRDVLGKMYTTGTDETTLLQLVTQTQEVEFLFDDDIKNYAEEVWRHADRLAAAK